MHESLPALSQTSLISRAGLIAIAVGVTLLRGLVGIAGIGDDQRVRSEFDFGFEQGHIAGHLAAGEGYVVKFGDGPAVPTAWASPAYPVVLAGVFRVWGSFTPTAARAVVWINAACHGLIAAMLVVLGARLADRGVGFLAAALFVVMPAAWQFLHWAWCVHLLAVFVLLWLVWMTGEAADAGRYGVKIGLALGLALLTDATVITLIPVMVVYVLRRLGWRRGAGAVLASGLTAAVVLSPWTVRNAIALGRPTPLRGMLGTALWMGNHPGAAAERYHGVAVSPFHEDAARARYEALGERGFDADALDRFRETYAADPGRFARATFHRATGFWMGEWWVRWRDYPAAFSAGRALLAVMAAAGLWCGWRRGVPVGALAGILLLFPLPYYITFLSYGRYRFPIEPVLCLLAAMLVVRRGVRGSGVSGPAVRDATF